MDLSASLRRFLFIDQEQKQEEELFECFNSSATRINKRLRLIEVDDDLSSLGCLSGATDILDRPICDNNKRITKVAANYSLLKCEIKEATEVVREKPLIMNVAKQTNSAHYFDDDNEEKEEVGRTSGKVVVVSVCPSNKSKSDNEESERSDEGDEASSSADKSFIYNYLASFFHRIAESSKKVGRGKKIESNSFNGKKGEEDSDSDSDDDDDNHNHQKGLSHDKNKSIETELKRIKMHERLLLDHERKLKARIGLTTAERHVESTSSCLSSNGSDDADAYASGEELKGASSRSGIGSGKVGKRGGRGSRMLAERRFTFTGKFDLKVDIILAELN